MTQPPVIAESHSTPETALVSGQMETPKLNVRLVRRDVVDPRREWDNELYRAQRGKWRLTGVAGSGVTSLLLDTVARRIAEGEDPERILVIAASKQAASRLRQGLVARVSSGHYQSAGTMVRSVHSLAFALLRRMRDENLRLITGAEQDAVIRDLLQGQIELTVRPMTSTAHTQAQQVPITIWPEECRDGIAMVGFARGLRDFLLRAVERGLGPEDLEHLGVVHDRPMWTAVGKFLREYEQTMALGGTHALSASELVSMVLEHDLPPDVQYSTVIVDDAQHLDPKSAELVGQVVDQAKFAVIAGDPEQSVYRFRGARPQFLLQHPVDHELRLHTSHRVQARPGAPGVQFHQLDSVTGMWELVADKVRRARLIDGVEWKDIAVVVRSVGMITPLRRALLAAGVPVHIDPTDIVLSQQRIVSALILAVRAVRHGLSMAELEELALGPIGGADAVTLRRLLRGLRQAELNRTGAVSDAFQTTNLRRSLEVLAELVLVADPDPDLLKEVMQVLTPREQDILDRIRVVLDAGRRGGSVEEVLWEIWSATNLDKHLLAVSLRGGAAGSQADRDLDSVMALFDAAGDWVERRPNSTIDAFIAHIEEQELPTGVRDRRLVAPDAVNIVTAHATSGQEWHTVVIAGVQEDSWPTLGDADTLFGQEELVDLIDDGIEPGTPISRVTERLREERRLFHMATSRATHNLIITTVNSANDSDVQEPSRFVQEYLDHQEATPQPQTEESDDLLQLLEQEKHHTADINLEDPLTYTRLLSVPAIVAELRRVVTNPNQTHRARQQAARQLARLAAAGVPGANPNQWWGLSGPSSTKPLQVYSLSPSRIEEGLECPLRASVQQVITEEKPPIHLLRGTLLHAFAEAIAQNVDAELALLKTVEAYRTILISPAWLLAHELDVWRTLLTRTQAWIANHRAMFEQVGVEIDADVTVAGTVRLRGRMDRLEKTPEGAYHIIDFKSGAAAPTQKDVNDNVQLLTYQLALQRGKLEGEAVRSGPGLPVDGATLVYPGTKSKNVTSRTQAAKTTEQLAEFESHLPQLLKDLQGPRLRAQQNKHCQHCQLKPLCPVWDSGRWTTEATVT
ncbi:MAG: ATP-dependent DNA helicase [Corynebacterium sp.]|nr:ATP-dependent DNA helicase [Corynebacterium sp.]